MSQYSIKQVETLSGVKAHTLRIWEQRYGLLKPERTDTNIRYYTDEQLRLLLNISTLNKHGIKISKIAGLNSKELSEKVAGLYQNSSSADDLLNSLVECMLDFDEQRFEKILSSAIIKLGFENTFTQLIFPFLQRTGVLWATGSVSVAQEHFISNLIRRKIYIAIDSQSARLLPDAKTFLLFLPENEYHELLLLYTEYLLRVNGQQVVYLGNNTPLQDINSVINVHPLHFLVTYITTPVHETDQKEYIRNLCKIAGKAKVIIGGLQTGTYQGKLPANCIIISSPEELKALLA